MPLSGIVDTSALAGELLALAKEEQLVSRKEELSALADDLAAGTDLHVWAEIDLVRAFVPAEGLPLPAPVTPPPLPLPRSKDDALRLPRALWAWLSGRPESWLEGALGVLVFLPLFVTWFGLRLAGGAYGELAREEPKQASRPFLQLWLSGFDGRLPWTERFDSVAMLAVLLILLLLAIAFLHMRTRSRADRAQADAEQATGALRDRLMSVLTRSQLALVGHRYASPTRFAAELTGAAGNLKDLTRRAAQSNDKLVAAAEAAERATDGLLTVADRLAREIPGIGDAAGRIETAVRDGADTLRAAQTAAVDAARTAQDRIERSGLENATALREVGDRVEAAGRLVDTALQGLTGTQQRLADLSDQALRASENASEAMVRSADSTGVAVDGMRQAADRWDAAAAHWVNAAARVDADMRVVTGGSATEPRDAVPGGDPDPWLRTPAPAAPAAPADRAAPEASR